MLHCTAVPPSAIAAASSHSLQKSVLWRGCDVVVGTPGRIIDHINRGNLKLEELQFVILDEADQMLDMGFADDMETILENVPAFSSIKSGGKKTDTSVQTLLFSATIPSWVKVNMLLHYLRHQSVGCVWGSRVVVCKALTPLVRWYSGCGLEVHEGPCHHRLGGL